MLEVIANVCFLSRLRNNQVLSMNCKLNGEFDKGLVSEKLFGHGFSPFHLDVKVLDVTLSSCVF